MDAETPMEAVKEGAKFAVKLLDIMQNFFTPYWTRKQADADEYSALKKIQTIRDNPDMMIVYTNGESNIRERTSEELEIQIKNRTHLEALRQENNIKNVLKAASEEIPPDKDVSDEQVDDDWIFRFFNIVKDISNKEMQYIWGKILAGEIKKPSSFSLRTLETLRNISAEEAKLFSRICNYIILANKNERYLPSYDELLNAVDIKYDDILNLDECGLINSSSLYLKTPVTSDEHYFASNDKYMLIFSSKSDDEEKINIRNYPLTKAGSEIFRILNIDTDDSFFINYGRCLKKEFNNINVKIYQYKKGKIKETDKIDLLSNE